MHVLHHNSAKTTKVNKNAIKDDLKNGIDYLMHILNRKSGSLNDYKINQYTKRT